MRYLRMIEFSREIIADKYTHSRYIRKGFL